MGKAKSDTCRPLALKEMSFLNDILITLVRSTIQTAAPQTLLSPINTPTFELRWTQRGCSWHGEIVTRDTTRPLRRWWVVGGWWRAVFIIYSPVPTRVAACPFLSTTSPPCKELCVDFPFAFAFASSLLLSAAKSADCVTPLTFASG